MENFRLKLQFVTLSILILSCSDFLEKEPLNGLNQDGYYQTEEDVVTGLIGAYNDLQDIRYIPHNFVANTSIAAGDAWEPNGGAQAFRDFEKLTVSSDNVKNLEIITKAFGGIGKVNRVQDAMSEMDIPEESKRIFEGEARFLRALNYYHVVGLFGGMPILRTAPTFGEEVDFTRATVQETWAFIIEDLQFAANALPANRNPEDAGRATRGSANALLARVLAMRAADDLTIWQEAKDAAQSVIDDAYSLDSDYENNFRETGDYNSESLFEIGYEPESADGTRNRFQPFATPTFGGGWSYGESFSNAYNNFEADDFIRRRTAVYKVGDSLNGSNVIWDGASDPEYLNPSPRGYVRAGTAKYNTPDSPGGNGINYKLLRYSEVLLVMAEAENELGNTAAALEYLKQVRDRVGLPTDLTLGDQEVVREIIFMERMAELCMEGVKFYDLVQRTRGRDFQKKTYNRDEFIFPIPQAEIEKTGWQQNAPIPQSVKDEFMAGVIVDIRG